MTGETHTDTDRQTHSHTDTQTQRHTGTESPQTQNLEQTQRHRHRLGHTCDVYDERHTLQPIGLAEL